VDERSNRPEAAAPAAMIRQFTAAEAAIYPLAMTDPDRYERAVTIVGLVYQQLRRDCPSVDALIDGMPAAAVKATELATAEGISLAGLAPDMLADAAAALRFRELGAPLDTLTTPKVS
jgi:hypothetical protein